MASITGKSNLFFITSPRSPYKMKDEIALLAEKFSGQKWVANRRVQEDFYRELVNSDFFNGVFEGDITFKARDRITRGPKALGLISLEPTISLTDAGRDYVYGRRPHEAFTRQLLKFQFPSPFHVDSQDDFFVRPYLELFRLIYELGDLSKDEIAAFVIQLIHLDKYELVKQKIIQFRADLTQIDRRKTNYNRFFDEVFTREIEATYAGQLAEGDILTRESSDNSRAKFVKTKKANHRDYADAATRYLRETRLVSFRSSRSNKLYIPDDKRAEVAWLLAETPRHPVFIDDPQAYQAYLFTAGSPQLFTDNREKLLAAVQEADPTLSLDALLPLSLEELKDKKEQLVQEKVDREITAQVNQLQLYEGYADIIGLFDDIRAKNVVDAPLFMEWNTWRAFVMLDDGDISGNFKFDDTGMPLSTAPGNQADMVCVYDNFDVLVEVTLSTGATQYKMEGEPVARHLGNHKTSSGRDSYCIFIASSLHEATLAHFYSLHKINIAYYGGVSKIIPLALNDFKRMLAAAYDQTPKPTAADIYAFVQAASDLALTTADERDWYANIQQLVANWRG
jgi:hypothetical protein